MKLKPPFAIYHEDVHIGDMNGHICTAENAEIAKEVLAALNSYYGEAFAAGLTLSSPVETP